VVLPVSLGSVEGQISSIEALANGGFEAALTAAEGLMSSSPAPTVTNADVGLPTALIVGGQTAPAVPQEPSAAQTLVNSTMAPAAMPAGAPAQQGQSPQSQLGAEAVSLAERYIGTPYLWGGASPSGFDCSGLVQYVYHQLGVNLPRTSQEQATVGTPVPSLADAQPGDLVFFAGTDGTAQSPGHVGIYIGNGEMVDAPYTGTDVQVQPVGDPVAIRRVTSLAQLAPSTGVAQFAGARLGPGASGLEQGATSPWAGLFASATGRYGLPPGLLQAVASTESNMSPGAVSSAGAEGLMQLMPSTAASMGVNPFDPVQAVPAAASLLASYLQRFGSLPLALAAYNAGPEAVAAYGGVPPYPQTEQYVSSVLSKMGEA